MILAIIVVCVSVVVLVSLLTAWMIVRAERLIIEEANRRDFLAPGLNEPLGLVRKTATADEWEKNAIAMENQALVCSLRGQQEEADEYFKLAVMLRKLKLSSAAVSPSSGDPR